MPRQIIINSTPHEARVALLEGPRLIELFIERARSRGVAGNIYKGKVTRVLPGMQAAFVDIGLERAGFLHASDVYPGTPKLPGEDVDAAEPAADTAASRNGEPPRRPPIEELLKKGDEVLVQVAKEPIGTKGARLTAQIALPGRYLIFTPSASQLGVSRRIVTERERARIREILAAEQPEGGLIARTTCEGLTKREIVADLRFLTRLWTRITKKAEQVSAPELLHYDMDLILRVVRDLLTPDIQRVLVDNPRDHERILAFIETVMPRLITKVTLYDEVEPIFDRFNIEPQIARALERKVRLKSGGYVVIDHTEAATVIDINTGRFVGKSSLEETSLRTNLEAVKTIVDQLRLRNIGGLIIIDFIDMADPAHRRQVYEALSEALKKEKSRTNILRLSELGLVEMTRKRTRESLPQLLCAACEHCGGTGAVKAPSTIAYDLLRQLRREAARNPDVARFAVRAQPAVVRFLAESEPRALEHLERDTGKGVALSPDPALSENRPFEILGVAERRQEPA